MKRSTRSFAGMAQTRLVAMQQQQTRAKEIGIAANTRLASEQGLRSAACLCCGNKNSETCNGCDA